MMFWWQKSVSSFCQGGLPSESLLFQVLRVIKTRVLRESNGQNLKVPLGAGSQHVAVSLHRLTDDALDQRLTAWVSAAPTLSLRNWA